MGTVRLTPTTIDGIASNDPIGDAMNGLDGVELLDSTVLMEPGLYPTPRLAERLLPARFEGTDDNVRVRRGQQDTFFFTNPETCRNTDFVRLFIEASQRAGVITDGKTKADYGGGPVPYYENLSFQKCYVDGAYDHDNMVGPHSKWGMLLHQVTGFVVDDCRIQNIKMEHGIYVHQGGHLDTLIQNTVFSGLGRCGYHEANRKGENDGMPATGELRIRGCTFDNCGRADGGGAITYSGRIGTTFIEDTVVNCTREGNALVAWPEYSPEEGKHGTENGPLVVTGFTATGNNCRRAIVQVSAVTDLVMQKSKVVRGDNPMAMWLNPQPYGMAGDIFPIRRDRRKLVPLQPDDVPELLLVEGETWIGEMQQLITGV
jgi:hypothetical protein